MMAGKTVGMRGVRLRAVHLYCVKTGSLVLRNQFSESLQDIGACKEGYYHIISNNTSASNAPEEV